MASAEAMKQLVALGYVAPPGDDAAKAVAETVAELKYNLARAHADAGDWEDAARLFEELHAGDPGDHRYIERAITALLVTAKRCGRGKCSTTSTRGSPPPHRKRRPS